MIIDYQWSWKVGFASSVILILTCVQWVTLCSADVQFLCKYSHNKICSYWVSFISCSKNTLHLIEPAYRFLCLSRTLMKVFHETMSEDLEYEIYKFRSQHSYGSKDYNGRMQSTNVKIKFWRTLVILLNILKHDMLLNITLLLKMTI